MIIDAHVHLSTHTGKGQSLDECTEILLKEMQQNGIDYAIVIPDNNEDDPKIAHLENTLRLIKRTDKLFALGSPQIMQRGSSEVSKYRELLEAGTIKGLKLFPGHEAYFPNDERKKTFKDKLHSDGEERFRIVGKTKKGRLLFIAFTIRKSKIRVISARNINKKEVYLYEETT